MDKVKKWVVDLADPMLKAYINYGHGLEEDGVSVTAKGIEFWQNLNLACIRCMRLN